MTSTFILTKGFMMMLESIAGCETSDLREQKRSGGCSGVQGQLMKNNSFTAFTAKARTEYALRLLR